MSNLKTRVDRLESKSTAGTVAGALGGMAVVSRDGDRYHTTDGRTLTQAELDATLASCKGRLLVLGWPSR